MSYSTYAKNTEDLKMTFCASFSVVVVRAFIRLHFHRVFNIIDVFWDEYVKCIN